MELKGKRVLMVGLGILGGGAATARWLVEQGVNLTVTDLKDREYLWPSLAKLEDVKGEIKFVLGGHEEKDFLGNDVVVINPDVPVIDNKFLKLARQAGKRIENELTLFYKFCPSRKITAITGTRGKTTTVNWTAHLLKSKNKDTLIIGNSPESPFLEEIKKCSPDTDIVIEAPSFLLEICGESEFAPHVAVITNIYRDHVSRHKSMEGYAEAKANIFKNQKKGDFLILNKGNKWTEFFLKQKPKAKVVLFSQEDAVAGQEEFVKAWGSHNLQNFAAASLAAQCAGASEEEIKERVRDLPQIKFRQEKIFENKRLQVVNDTAATSPEATMAALERFDDPAANLVLITGGTDKDLDFSDWGNAVKKHVKPENLILLSGSATEKMKRELGWKPDEFSESDSLDDCLKKALDGASKSGQRSIILFSPSSKSFEKFKNEFDRGEKFNKLVSEALDVSDPAGL